MAAPPVLYWSKVNRDLEWRGLESVDVEPHANKEPTESIEVNSYASTGSSETGQASRRQSLDVEEDRSIKIFKLTDVENAVNSNGAKNIGEGGFGIVTKCILRGETVAIKRLKAGGGADAVTQFRQEVMVLGEMYHPYLVKLIGVCYEERALVYEFVQNGSLGDYMEEKPAELLWQLRTNIIYQMCLALNYVHSRPEPLVHGDLKPDNVLLDGDMNVKLADFGMCRFLPPGQASQVFFKASRAMGTEDYIDPEFKETMILSPACDVYSFGITILKILTGKHPATILRKMRRACKTGTEMELVDPTAGNWNVGVAKHLAYYGVMCCSSKDRMKIMREMKEEVGKIVGFLTGTS